MCRVVKEKVDENLSVDGIEPYFVDFFRDPPEATGDEEGDVDLEAPKVYEEVSLRWKLSGSCQLFVIAEN